MVAVTASAVTGIDSWVGVGDLVFGVWIGWALHRMVMDRHKIPYSRWLDAILWDFCFKTSLLLASIATLHLML